MKYIYLPLLIFFVCCSNNKKTRLEFYNESIEWANEIILWEISNEYENGTAETLENPTRNKLNKRIVDTIRIKSQALLHEIDRKRKILNNKQDSHYYNEEKIQSLILDYDEFVDSLAKDSSIFSDYFVKSWNEIESFKKTNELEDLNLLTNVIINTNYWLAYEYVNKLLGLRMKEYNKLKIATISESNFLHQNETFTSNLFLLAYDTTTKIQIELSGKELRLTNGIAFFCDSSYRDIGTYIEKGVVRKKEPFTNIIRQYPFKLKYKVVEK